jgi:hypothetical protein
LVAGGKQAQDLAFPLHQFQVNSLQGKQLPAFRPPALLPDLK